MEKEKKEKKRHKNRRKEKGCEQQKPHGIRPKQEEVSRSVSNRHGKLPEQTIANTYRYQEISDIIECFQKTRSALEDGPETMELLSASKSGNIQSASQKSSILFSLICGSNKMSATDDYSYRTSDVKTNPAQLLKELGSAQKERRNVLEELPKTKGQKQLLESEDRCQNIRMTLTGVIRSAVDNGEEALRSLEQRIRNMEEEFKKERSALTEKVEELTSFKDRVAGDVASSIKTGTTINLNNPVSKPRLIELYDDLRRMWPKIKNSLKSNQENPNEIKKLMQKHFKRAKTDMLEKMEKIDDIFGLNTSKGDAAASKVWEYKQLTIQNLQLAIYSGKQGGLKDSSQVKKYETPKDVTIDLANKCYRLGCLMALNDPPLEPDWNNPPKTYDKWDILPQNITESVKDQEKTASSFV